MLLKQALTEGAQELLQLWGRCPLLGSTGHGVWGRESEGEGEREKERERKREGEGEEERE